VDPEVRHLIVPRRLRYAALPGATGRIEQVWFVLHGYGQLAPRFIRAFKGLAAPTRHIVAPEGLHRHYVDHANREVGASWMTSEDRSTDIEDYVAYLDLLYESTLQEVGAHRADVRVLALGFSQGVHTLCRWISFGAARFDRAILWGAVVPPDLDLSRDGDPLRSTDLRLVVGTEDEYFGRAAVEAHEASLRGAGVPFRSHSYAGGHRIDSATLASLAET